MNQITKELIRYIIEQTCDMYGVDQVEFFAKTRIAPTPEARHMAWAVITTVIPYNEINISNLGKFCHRTHSNVISGIKKINGLCESEKETKKRKEKLVSLAKNHLFCITDKKQAHLNIYRPNFTKL